MPKKNAQLPFNFRALMTKQRSEVQAALQLWGDFPDCNPQHCCSQDWQHALMDALTSVFEQVRLDESDPLVIKAAIRHLATLAAGAEMWAESLEGV